MSQLLVRGLDEKLVQKLKRRASARGVSVEEEHRTILKDVLNRSPSQKPSLMSFLLSAESSVHPAVELDIQRARQKETHREVQF